MTPAVISAQKFLRGDRVRVCDPHITGSYGDDTPMISAYSGHLAEVVGSYADIAPQNVMDGYHVADREHYRHIYKLRFIGDAATYGEVSWFSEKDLTLASD